MSPRNAAAYLSVLLFALIPVSVYGAEVRKLSTDDASYAGQYMGIADQCFSNIEMVVTKKARIFANYAKKIHPKTYAKAYNEEMKGPRSFFDESYCYDETPKAYGKNGDISRHLGFRIFDTENLVE